MRYDLSALARRTGKASGGRVIMPPIAERLGTIKDYRKALGVMLRAIAAETTAGVIPAYRADKLTRDVDEYSFQRIRDLGIQLSRSASQTVNRILELESIRHSETFIAQARKVLGVDVSAVVRPDDVADYMRNAAARNTSLIKSLSDDAVKRVEQAVIQNQIEGNSVATLKKTLTAEFGILSSRAELIAQDQTAKLTSDLNRFRQEQAGIEAYRWSTSADERVRARHRVIDGKEYKWGEPTGAEGGAAPGQPVRCRCIARAIIEFEAPKVKKRSAARG